MIQVGSQEEGGVFTINSFLVNEGGRMEEKRERGDSLGFFRFFTAIRTS